MTSCIHSIHNHAPYPENSKEGITVAVLKRAVLGIIASALLAVAGYYITIAHNMWNMSPDTLANYALYEAWMDVIVLSGFAILAAALSVLSIKPKENDQVNQPEVP